MRLFPLRGIYWKKTTAGNGRAGSPSCSLAGPEDHSPPHSLQASLLGLGTCVSCQHKNFESALAMNGAAWEGRGSWPWTAMEMKGMTVCAEGLDGALKSSA